MLSSVLNSPRAILVNIEIMRTFVRLRRLLESNVDLAQRLNELEQKYDSQFQVVFDAIRRPWRRQIPRDVASASRPSPPTRPTHPPDRRLPLIPAFSASSNCGMRSVGARSTSIVGCAAPPRHMPA